MHHMVEKEKELSLYLEEWITARYSDWNMFYHSTNQNKRNGIYLLKSGARLMDLLDDIMGNIEEHFAIDANSHIIPSRFSSIPQLLQFLDNFQKHIKKQFHLSKKNMPPQLLTNRSRKSKYQSKRMYICPKDYT